ncbi:MAG: redoxin domain-containing protein [Verrucomicrobiales bacterium]
MMIALMRAGSYRLLFFFFALALGGITPHSNAMSHGGHGSARIGISMSGQGPLLSIHGMAGEYWTIESSSNLSREWDVLASFRMTNSMAEWLDTKAANAPFRFYRSVRHATPPSAAYASNFRLLDQAGKSRELYYHYGDPNLKAVVLIFSSLGCENLPAQKTKFTQLQADFGAKGIAFWLVESKQGATRSQINALSTELGIPWPILQDRAQSVSRSYGAEATLEVVAISVADMSVFYRGAIDAEIQSHSGHETATYLKTALTQFIAGTEVGVTTTQPTGCDLPLVETPSLNYSSDIAPILQAKCVVCHSPGNVAPWAMTNYAIIKRYSSAMNNAIMTRKMPPWHADPEYGHFANDRSLSIEEERRLLSWIAEGSPRGTGPDPLEVIPPAPPKWPAELGEPDIIIRPPVQTIRASGVEPYRYIFVESGIPSNVWVKAAIVRPSNTSVVHHYIVWEGHSTAQQAAGIAGYVPGTSPLAFPPDTGILLNKNVDLTFNLHYTPNGKEQTDQPELALWYHKAPPAKMFRTLPLAQLELNIPPHTREHEVSVELFPLPVELTVHRMAPHMHVRGTRMKYEAILPGGARETLLSVPNYSFHWQTTYELAEPRRLPKGTILVVSGAFDNSSLNIHNPDPTQSVHWGEQSWEEMFIGYIDYTE